MVKKKLQHTKPTTNKLGNEHFKKLQKRLSANAKRRGALIVKHQALMKQFVVRNRAFFSWFFYLSLVSKEGRTGWRMERFRSGVRFGERKRWQEWANYRRFVKVGPKINLRIAALVSRLAKHGQKSRARRMVESVLILLGEHGAREKAGVTPSLMVNAVLMSLEPPFEVRVFKRRWGSTYYPSPIWPHRKYFLAAKLLVAGARKYQKLYRCPFVVALVEEIVAVFQKKSDSYTVKMYRKLIKLGVKHKSKWQRFVKVL